jgi:hypothetical protein
LATRRKKGVDRQVREGTSTLLWQDYSCNHTLLRMRIWMKYF